MKLATLFNCNLFLRDFFLLHFAIVCHQNKSWSNCKMSECLAKKPVKLFSLHENRKKDPKTDTTVKFTKSFSGSMLPQPYSRNTKRSATMFEKMFRNSPSKYTSRILKHPYRRRNRINEIERCTNIQQRDQYRLLIAQYSNKSLAETASIFCKPTPLAKTKQFPSRAPATPLIDLSETPTKQNGGVTPRTTAYDLPHHSNINLKTASPSLQYKSATPLKTLPVPLLQSRFESKMTSETATNTPLSKTSEAAEKRTPKASISSPIDWFSPKSPYLAKNFVSDLVNTYSRRERERKRILVEEETRARLLQEKRQVKEELLAQLLEERLKVTPKEQEIIEELSEEIESKVDEALVSFPPQQVLVEAFNISITREHMATLSGLNWLNDEVINFYMELIVERSKKLDNLPSTHAMNTFFYPKLSKQGYKSVRRWTKKVDIFSKSLILFPIHLGVHWTLAVADFRCKELRYYDSMGGVNTECLTTLRDYLASEHLDKKKTSYEVGDWKTVSHSPQDIPQQMNGSDCGVFTCTFAEFISRDAPLNFTQSHMPLLRRTMVWEMLNRALTR